MLDIEIDLAIWVLQERIKVVENAQNCAADFETYCELKDAFDNELDALRLSLKSLTGWKERLQRHDDTELPFN